MHIGSLRFTAPKVNCRLARAAAISCAVLLAAGTAAQSNWVRIPTPLYRDGAAVAYDALRGVTVMFGGVTPCFTSLGDTWEWDGRVWRARTEASPPKRSYATAIYHSARRSVLLFGGTSIGGTQVPFVADLWEWNGTVWKQLNFPGPEGRQKHSMAYDPLRNVVVVFGGETTFAGYLGDTWEWDETGWRQIPSPASPTARSGAAFAFDPRRGACVLYGGLTVAGRSAETWLYDASGWRLVAAEGPGGRSGSGLVANVDQGSLILVSGVASNSGASTDSWSWDGSRWRDNRSAPARRFAPVVYDIGRSAVCLPTGIQTCSALLGVSESVSGGSWRQTGIAGLGYRNQFAAAYDSVRGYIVTHGGFEDGMTSVASTLLRRDMLWEAVPTGLVSQRYQHAMTFDTVRGVAVMFGGRSASGVFNETFERGDGNWIRRTTGGPAGRAGHSMAFDSERQRVVLFGGATSVSGGGLVGDTWEWDGANWTRVAVVGPSPRRRAAMAFDPIRRQTVLFGGASSSAVFGDTWIWDGANWSQRTVPGPSARAGAGLAFDPTLNKIVLVGGQAGIDVLADTWQWDGSRWELLPIQTPARSDAGLVFDGRRSALVLFGGIAADGADTWELRSPCSDAGLQDQDLRSVASAGRAATVGLYFSGSNHYAVAWSYAASPIGPWTALLEGDNRIGENHVIHAVGTKAPRLRVGSMWPTRATLWLRATFETPCSAGESDPASVRFAPTDLDGDGMTTVSDVSAFANAYDLLLCTDIAMPLPCPSDYNHDGVVDDLDWQIFVVAYSEDVANSASAAESSGVPVQPLRSRTDSNVGADSSTRSERAD